MRASCFSTPSTSDQVGVQALRPWRPLEVALTAQVKGAYSQDCPPLPGANPRAWASWPAGCKFRGFYDPFIRFDDLLEWFTKPRMPQYLRLPVHYKGYG